ncbi:follistatin-related protein 1-like isoform X2 [Anneissia japonica]|uniref:follistatin-related protein 1-like isoform X2 n=1 Tax=Anneissia japonica TaxID=1529436 RepID=UPI0014257BC2|nr:follistatin-related protein 1-like isoform X2 [Anneissia japonica]
MQLSFLFCTFVYFIAIGFTYSTDDVSKRPHNGTDLKRFLKNRNRAEKLACRGVDCSSGRQCALDDAGQVTCICIKKCSKNDRPICASNGQTFRNKCEMHRHACIAGIQLSKNHSKPCLEPESHQLITKKKIRPIVCYENDRDTIHEKIVEWIDSLTVETAKNKFQIIQDKFMTFDSDFDGTLNSAEFQTFIESNEAVSVITNITDPEEQDAYLIRGICVDALIESADVTQDWKLNLGELSSCLDKDFSPLKRKCSLDDKEYDDGNAVKKMCNVCVCGCGNWVCTAHICDESKHKIGEAEAGGINEDDLVMTQTEWEAKLKQLAEGAVEIGE